MDSASTIKTPTKAILVVGLFLSEKNKATIMRTAADQLAELLHNNGIPVIKVSQHLGKVKRFADTLYTIFSRRKSYNIGIVPLYGGLMSYTWEAVSSTLLKILGKKVVLIIHGGSIPGRLKKNPGKYFKSFRRADVIVCPSAYIQTVLAEYGFESILIENVVQLDEYTFHKKEYFRPRLFWMRTLEDVYNPEMAIRVAGILAKKYPGLRLVMAGYDRGLLSLLRQLAASLQILDKVEFPGYISKEQKNEYAASHDIYLCTNRIDNAPVSFIEMMALGLPIVSVNTGGIPYLLRQGHNGLMVNLDDDQAMADAIESIIKNPGTGMEMANNGVAFARQFDAAPVIKKWQDLFEQLSPAIYSKHRIATQC